jgi:hypothetical protein
MNKLNFLSKLAIAGVTGIAALTFPMKAEAASFIIDDFNGDPATTSGSSAADNTIGDGGVLASSPIDPGNTVMNILGGGLWSRQLYAELLSGGDQVRTVVCYGCQEGHAFSDFPPGSTAVGIFEWRYTGSTFNASKFNHFKMDYLDTPRNVPQGSIKPGGVVELYFDGVLAAQSNPLPGEETSLMLPLLISPSSVSNVTIRIDGVPGLDASPDNAKLVTTPEPGTILGLLAVGGLGLGLKRKKQS